MKSIAGVVLFKALLCLLSFQTANDCGSVPAKNKKIVAYMKTKIGKTVGEYCNDFFHEAYKAGGTTYHEVFGYPGLDFTKDCIYPGDMIILKNVSIIGKRNGESTGIKYDNWQINYLIYKVISRGVYEVVRTETIDKKDKVTLTEIDIDKFKGTKPQIYHPA